MIGKPFEKLEDWVGYFGSTAMPILRQTVRRLDEARQSMDNINGRDIAAIVLQDPLLAVRVLAYIQPFRGKHLRTDITTIGGAILMLGVEPFFKHFEAPRTLEDLLKHESQQALLGALHVIRRAQRSSRYAYEWALERHDLNVEEVALAALLHDLAEILLWCFAPQLAIEVRRRQLADKNLRSAAAQMQVLGLRLVDLQRALCHEWHLPELLKTLMDDAHAEVPRVQNVTLAVNLARHSANDWDNPALPDDLAAIEKLLHIDRATLIGRLHLPDDIAARFLGPAPQDGGNGGA